MNQTIELVIRTLCCVGSLPSLLPEQDFYAAGFSSVRALDLLLELEAVFGVVIPDDAFVEARSPAALASMIESLKKEAAL